MPDPKATCRNPWLWVCSLYLAEGIPNVVVSGVAVIMYKDLGISNTDITLYTFWLYLPWVIKPLWSPIVDILKTRRVWILAAQLVIGGGLAGVAWTLPAARYFQYSLAFFWLLAFSSATHDIAADGFYMLALDEAEQSFFVGIRNTFYRIAMISGQGLLVILAGKIHGKTGPVAPAWSIAFAIMAGLFLCLAVYHCFILPRPAPDKSGTLDSLPQAFDKFLATFLVFFQKPRITTLLLFLLFYRFGEAQLVRMVPLFLLDPREVGGLGLTTEQVGVVYNTIGVIALMAGGIAGGVLVSRLGLRACLWPMVLVMHLPDAVFIYLSHVQPENLNIIGAGIAVEQFGYGFGFTAYMLYMIYIARGEHQTAHYAICTGFMALGLMLPQMFSGWLQEHIGYRHFFIWVLFATIPGFIMTALIPLDAGFGRKTAR